MKVEEEKSYQKKKKYHGLLQEVFFWGFQPDFNPALDII